MAVGIVRDANISPSKRSFEQVSHSDFVSSWQQHHQQQRPSHAVVYHRADPSFTRPPSHPNKRRALSLPKNNRMLADTTAIMSGSFPSLMSVFGSEDTQSYRDVALDDQTKFGQHAFTLPTADPTSLQTHSTTTKPRGHRDSITSLASDSTESSPTTTNSTFDSPVISESSPNSSPESASSMYPLTSFETIMQSPDDRQSSTLKLQKPLPRSLTPVNIVTQQEPVKNVKNLTLDLSLPCLTRSATTNSFQASYTLSAPSSPHKEPLKSARRKPANLSIRTPGFQTLTFAHHTSDVPPTPSTRPLLHQHQSSPSLSALASPSAAPAGGMHLPLPSLGTGSKHSSFSSFEGSRISSHGSSLSSNLPELREEDDGKVPGSQEVPEQGYTEGPVCIYDTGVYLYLEPTAQEASNFDTIINVAKEIKNPFLESKFGEETVMSVWRNEANPTRLSISEPQTATSELSFKSALEWPQADRTNSPTTPTQSSFDQKPKLPEYIHVKWDHNTEILQDLYPLCTIIDERIQDGKKVLVHCQLGVSRSASLIIAYGLYKGLQPDFHSMYMAVKERSRWVGPNMSLIYQLTDFRSKINRGEYSDYVHSPNPDWWERLDDITISKPPAVNVPISVPLVTNASSIAMNSTIDPVANTLSKKITPLQLNKALPPVPLFPKHSSHDRAPTISSISEVIETWSEPTVAQSQNVATVKRSASRPLPFRERASGFDIPAHRPKLVPGVTFRQSSSKMDLAMQDVPMSPSLFSPRATEFVATPFGIRGAGDLANHSNRNSQSSTHGLSWLPLRKEGHVRTASTDPRSPHQQAEPKEIFRHIDGFL